MLKSIFSIVSLLFLSNLVHAGAVDKDLHEKCLYPTIFIGRVDEKSTGSGVVVRSDKMPSGEYKNVFLSCAHIIKEDGYDDYVVKHCIYDDWSTLKEVRFYPALICAYSHDLDLSIGVFISPVEMPIAKINFKPKLFIGNEVFRIGCGFGDEPRLDYGKLTWKKEGGILRTSIFTVPGDSGSPLFHENEVIGIMTKVRVYRKNMVFNISFAVTADTFLKWSNNYGNSLNFAWDNKKELPKMHFYYLNFKNYEIKR